MEFAGNELAIADEGRNRAGAEGGGALFRLILDIASGRKRTWADRWGLHNALTLFNPAPVT